LGIARAVTQVTVPSRGHEEVPYWCVLTEDESGVLNILKSDTGIEAGDSIPLRGPRAADLAVVGIVGTGVMGRGLAELLLSRGHRIVWCGRSTASLANATERVFERLARVMDDNQLSNARTLIRTDTRYAPLADCDVIIEAVAEEMPVKRVVLPEIEKSIRSEAVLATNTSGLSIDELAETLSQPGRFGALHFFNPPTRMRLVEVAVSEQTTDETREFLEAFARSLGKVPIEVAATPAFAVNRALMPLLNEAVRELEERVAPAEAIDEAIRLGLNHPMGPLALADLIGLDVVVDIMQNLAERTADESYAPRPLLLELVSQGHLGRKTSRGFYEYSR
jgi:3-hydroxybutyryl-CoA dehydrogenase